MRWQGDAAAAEAELCPTHPQDLDNIPLGRDRSSLPSQWISVSSFCKSKSQTKGRLTDAIIKIHPVAVLVGKVGHIVWMVNCYRGSWNKEKERPVGCDAVMLLFRSGMGAGVIEVGEVWL